MTFTGRKSIVLFLALLHFSLVPQFCYSKDPKTDGGKLEDARLDKKKIDEVITKKASDEKAEKQQKLSVLFVLYCSKGHINPNIGIANELTANGHNVDVFLTASFCADEIQRRIPDVRKVIPTDVSGHSFVNPNAPLYENLQMVYELFYTNHTVRIYERLSKHLKDNQYDVIINDDFVPGGVMAAKVSKTPVVTVAVNSMELLYKEDQERGNFVEDWTSEEGQIKKSTMQTLFESIPFFGVLTALHYSRSDPIFKFAQDIHAKNGLEPVDDSENDGNLPLTYYYRHAVTLAFGPPHLILRNVSKLYETNSNIHYVGHVPEPNARSIQGLTGELLEFIEKSDKPVIFVSLGTVMNLEFTIMLSLLKEFESQTKYRIIWAVATGNFTQLRAEQTSFDNLILSSFVPQTAVLNHEKTKVFLTHCGANSVQDSVYAAKPMLTFPGFGDQQVKSKRITNLGIGSNLREFTFPQIDKDLMEMLKPETYNAMVAKLNVLKNQMLDLGGFKTAAKLVERIASGDIRVNEKAGDQLGTYTNAIFYISAMFLATVLLVVFISFWILKTIYVIACKRSKDKAE